MTFLEFLAQSLGATITTADKTADGTADICVDGNVITQSQFSTSFTAWLKGGDVFGSDDFKTFVANQLHADASLTQQFIDDTLAMLDAGTYTVELNQNSEGAPYIVELVGLIDFNDLFSDGVSTDVKTGGKVTQDRWYVNEYQTHEAAHYLTFDFHTGLTVVADNTSDYVDNTQDEHFNGAGGLNGIDGSNDTLVDTSSSISGEVLTGGNGTDGGFGENGMDAYAVANADPYAGIKIISEGVTENFILGGEGGGGGDGGDGGDATATASDTNKSVNESILTGGDGGDGGSGGSGGHAIVNGDLSTVIIEGSQDLTVLGGTSGAGGVGGAGGDATVSATKNTNNDTITAGDGGDGGAGSTGGDGGTGGDASFVNSGVESGTVTTDGSNGEGGESSPIIAAFSDRVDVNASTFTGHLTISGSDYNDTMVFGSGGTTVYATTGDDAYTFNSAADEIIIYTAANQSDGTSTDTINGFDINNDQINISAITQAGWASSWDDATDVLSIDLNGDSTDDMVINLVGVNAANVDAILLG